MVMDSTMKDDIVYSGYDIVVLKILYTCVQIVMKSVMKEAVIYNMCNDCIVPSWVFTIYVYLVVISSAK